MTPTDMNCYTLPDGSCIGHGCMHDNFDCRCNEPDEVDLVSRAWEEYRQREASE